MIMKGQKINDRYQIIKTIGEGGMANVYLAYDTILDRNVAVKVLRGDLATDEKFVRRFQREALSASSLSHPNIVEVYDVGEDNGSYYIVMEYIKGKHLKQLLKQRGKLTLTEVVDIMQQVTDGMSAAHDSYIIHRDIKPQNIMILENGLIKITDFGIAMALNSTQLTQTNSVMGSVHYLPPEQASGKAATVQSDVYSMGILMYELLTGELPYRGDNAVEIALKHIKEPFPRIKEKISSLPQSIENIILKATAKNTKNRYADARELHEDLKTALTDERANEPLIEFENPEGDENVKSKDIEKTVKENKALKAAEEAEIKATKIDEKAMKKKENKLLLILAIIFTALIVIITTIVFLVPTLSNVKDVRVPDVTGMTIDEAEEELEKVGLKVSSEIKEDSSDTIAEGSVIKTSPLKNRKAKVNTEVILYISTGSNAYEVEDLTGQDYQYYKGVLEQMYGLYVTVSKIEDKENKYSANQIIKTEPGVGEKLTRGKQIILYIPDMKTTYPDFTSGSYTLAAIRDWCSQYGVGLEVNNVTTNDYPAGKIYYQDKKVGATVNTGDILHINIAQELVVDNRSAEEIDQEGA